MEYKYSKICLGCQSNFDTNYRNKKYCGSKDCEKIRQSIKNRTAQKKRESSPDYKKKTKENYLRNRKKILEDKRQKYRKNNNILPEDIRGPRIDPSTLSEPEPISHSERSSQRLEYDQVKEEIQKEGYVLLSRTYKNNNSKLKVLCPKNHTVDIRFLSFSRGHRCSECAKHFTTSLAEREITQRLKDIDGGLIIRNNFKLFDDNNQEVDLYFPEQKVAIEYCGLYWHSEAVLGQRLSKTKNVKQYHRQKLENCKQKNIRLITVFEDEYLNKPEVVISRIANALAIGQSVVYGRDCYVKQIDSREASDFLKNYHLQNAGSAEIRWGLYFQNRLLQVLSAGKSTRKHTDKEYNIIELKRFASLPFVTVLGGFSKLFSRLKDYAKVKEFQVIKSYADMRYANPFQTVYDKTGFILKQESKYTPHYVKDKKRFRNQSLCKTPEEKLTGKTEWELRREQGYDRIWDCGHRTYFYYL